MPKDWRSTRAWRALVEQCKRTYGWTCHLCGQPIPRRLEAGHPLSYQADHVLPYATHPLLGMALSNLRPSHRRCNQYRGARPLTPALVAQITARFRPRPKPALRFFDTA